VLHLPVRKELEEQGILLEDKKDGTTLKVKVTKQGTL
jgi:hypothetical protein